jgi:hypothetical protein
MSKSDSDLFIYTPDENTLDLDGLENDLNGFEDPGDVVEYLWSTFLLADKNRFAISKAIYTF